jgi:hypothetical protein
VIENSTDPSFFGVISYPIGIAVTENTAPIAAGSVSAKVLDVPASASVINATERAYGQHFTKRFAIPRCGCSISVCCAHQLIIPFIPLFLIVEFCYCNLKT